MTRIFVVFLVLALSACARKFPPPLTYEEQSTYRLEQVVVLYPDDADIWCGDGERLLAAAAGTDVTEVADVDAYMDSPAAQRELRDLAASRIEPIIFRNVNPILRGDQPAQLTIRIRAAHVSSSAQQLLVGGNHGLEGDVQLFDLRTAAPLTPPLRVGALATGGSGIIGAAIDAGRSNGLSRAAGKFGSVVQRWLAAQREVDLGLDVAAPSVSVPPLPAPSVQ